MKQENVKVGGTYLTKIGAALCAVIVVREHADASQALFGRRKRFDVRRVNEARVLGKPRTAASLREIAVRARLDASGTAKPLSSIVGHAPRVRPDDGKCIAIDSTPVPGEYRSGANVIVLADADEVDPLWDDCMACIDGHDCPVHPRTGNEQRA